MNRRQLPGIVSVVPNAPVRPPVVTVRPPQVTQTVVVPRPALTPVRPGLSGIATPTGPVVQLPPPARPNPISTVLVPPSPRLSSVPVAAPSVPAAVPSVPASIPSLVPATTASIATSPPAIPSLPASSRSSTATTIPTGQADASNAGATSKGVSPTAIGVVAGVVALAVVCAAAFFIRRRFLRRRSQRRKSWTANLYTDRRDAFTGPAAPFEKPPQPQSQPYNQSYNQSYQPYQAQAPVRNDEAQMPNPYDRYPAQQQYSNAPSPLPISYNNPQDSYYSPPPSAPRSLAPSAYSVQPTKEATTDANAVTVLRVFIPSLPDELHISAGERVRIVNAYDDGWALCANSRGEQGVVPLECLDRSQAAQASQGGDWRNLKRSSSLYSTAGPPATGY